GGGVYAHNSLTDLTIENSAITGNRSVASSGGGLFLDGGLPTIRRTKITYNIAQATGGGLHSIVATVIDRCTVSGNSALTLGAGGISQLGGSLTVTNSPVRGNHADQAGGGGIRIENTVMESTLVNSTVSGNTAGGGGGLALVTAALVTIRNSTVSGNTTTG